MNTKLNIVLYGILFSGLGAFSYLLLINYTNLSNDASKVISNTGALLFFIMAFNILGYATIKISSWLNNQYTLNIKKRGKIILIYTIVTLMFLFLNYGLLVTAKLIAGSSHPFTFPNGGLRILITVWLVELVILGLLLANKSIKSTLILQQQAAKLQEENNTARYTALQNQLNPHFLFNSLNTLIAEIKYNPQNAINFTKNLSNVYRYVLQCQSKPLVSLNEELEFADAYLFLHKVRLGNCIAWHTNIPIEYTEYLLPPLTLQLLIENVIKHNSISTSKPMTILLKIEDNQLIVSNPITPKKSSESSGIGLKNLSNRYKLIIGQDISIINKDNKFTVKVPFAYE